MRTGIKTIITGAALFILGGFVIPLLIVLSVFLGKSNEVQFKVPVSTQATIEKPGRYYLWNDFRTVYDGKSYNRSESIPDGMKIQIHNSRGDLLKFVSDTSMSSSVGTSSKNSIGYIEVESSGKVSIEVLGGNEDRIFSFSESGLLKMIGLFLGGFGLSMLVAFSGIGTIIWGIVKLVREKRKGENAGGNAAPPRASA